MVDEGIAGKGLSRGQSGIPAGYRVPWLGERQEAGRPHEAVRAGGGPFTGRP